MPLPSAFATRVHARPMPARVVAHMPGLPAAAKFCLPSVARLLPPASESQLRRLVACHMARLRSSALYAAEPDAAFQALTAQLADFVVRACSCVPPSSSLPLTLNGATRELWLVQLWHAFDDAAFPLALRPGYWCWAETLSVRLLAPAERDVRLSRYPYDTVRSWFLPGDRLRR